MRNRRRSGLSLIEVVISLFILATSAAILAQLLESARQGATKSALETEALLACESILAEIVSSEVTPSAVAEEPFGEEENWFYSVGVEETERETLVIVTVEVFHRSELGAVDATVTLTRWLFVPSEEMMEELESELSALSTLRPHFLVLLGRLFL